MTDRIAKEKRRALMARVRSKNTKPEMIVRKMLYSMGYRYRLHRKELPGTPDIVLNGKKKVIFVNGCFWHGHDCKAGRNIPVSRMDYWLPKLQANKKRDQRNISELKHLGWDILIIWECEVKESSSLAYYLSQFMES